MRLLKGKDLESRHVLGADAIGTQTGVFKLKPQLGRWVPHWHCRYVTRCSVVNRIGSQVAYIRPHIEDRRAPLRGQVDGCRNRIRDIPLDIGSPTKPTRRRDVCRSRKWVGDPRISVGAIRIIVPRERVWKAIGHRLASPLSTHKVTGTSHFKAVQCNVNAPPGHGWADCIVDACERRNTKYH